jgi:hypothetical protein
MAYADHHATPRSHLQPDEVGWPELVVSQQTSLCGEDTASPQGLGLFPGDRLLEHHLVALLATTEGADDAFAALDEDVGAGLEIPQILELDIEAEEPVEAVRPAESADADRGLISRGTRLQR